MSYEVDSGIVAAIILRGLCKITTKAPYTQYGSLVVSVQGSRSDITVAL